MTQLTHESDITGALEKVKGSDNRQNVSSRQASRRSYNSRDQSETYSLVFDDANATAGDYVVYLQNKKTDGKTLVVSSIGVNCEAASSSFKLSVVTGTAGGGTEATPSNMNQADKAKSATVNALTTADSSVTPMSGLTEDKLIDHAGISGVYGHEEFRLDDTLRIGQDQAIAIELEYAAAADVRAFGVIFFYFE